MKDKTGKLIRQRDIYWVNFDPSVGSEIKKKRPALVLQDHYVAEHSQTVLVCPITSGKHRHPFDVSLSGKGLSAGSRIRAIQVVTCDVSRFDGYMGVVDDGVWDQVMGACSVDYGDVVGGHGILVMLMLSQSIAYSS